MLALAITISVILLIALLRFGVIVEYGEAGFQLWAKAGIIKFQLMDEDKEKKPKKKKEKKGSAIDLIKPGNLSAFIDMLRAVKNTLSRLKRKLLIKQLTLYYTSAGDDPANTAIRFGATNVIFVAIVPLLERNFRIKRRDFRVSADFNTNEQSIYAKITITIAVWEVFYVLFALLPILTAAFKSKSRTRSVTDRKDRKDEQKYGKSPDKRVDGVNDAENARDDRR